MSQAKDSLRSRETTSTLPSGECDVVMKGGITSGVVYPKALSALGSAYRIRGIGGASAGAIGAAVGAAAEFGRLTGGFDRLETLPDELGDGQLASLFQPQRSTRQLLRLMLAATGSDRPGPPRTGLRRFAAIPKALVAAFPWASIIGILPGAALVILGAASGGWKGWLLVAAGIVLLLIGWVAAMALRLVRKLTVDVPENLFGICRGRGRDDDHPGFTDWLSDRIDDIAGLPAESRPLRFGHLWTGRTEVTVTVPPERQVDLRMITTCLSEGRPYELPWAARRFFYDPTTWRTLFSGRVVDALEAAPPPASPDGDDEEWRWEETVAAAQKPALRRLPDPEHLPVIVATRLSLSFPLLISAVPLWTIDRRHPQSRETLDQYRVARRSGTPPPASGLRFSRLWFTDGGFCSNFPVHLFDAALASRPTFAINLGRFPGDRAPDPDQEKNVEWARNNRALLPTPIAIPERGFGAVGAFASAALNTARNWQDGSHLDHPGFRDRIVRVLQTKREGGLNLYMDAPTIQALAERGRTAGTVMIEQFTQPHYPMAAPTATGWDNHRWVRYRALLSVLPAWLASYARGRAVLDIDPAAPPSYELSAAGRDLAGRLAAALDAVAEIAAQADPESLANLTGAPRPIGAIRRIPQI
jgi:predicted acylesterase/phospholipase RssA